MLWLCFTASLASAQILEWTYPANTNATGFNAYRAPVTGATCGPAAKINPSPIPITTLTYTDTTAILGASYCYAVTAFNAQGESPPSNVIQYGKPLPPPTLVTITAAVRFQGNGAGGTVVSDPPGFDIDRAGTYQTQMETGASVHLTATPKSNHSRFIGWGGACAPAGVQPVCSLTLTADAAFSATFSK
jgi:hypothetical protein